MTQKAPKSSKFLTRWALGDPQNVGLSTCFKNPEKSRIYPCNKPNIDFLRASMPIDKE
jgi:hypothetical protein